MRTSAAGVSINTNPSGGAVLFIAASTGGLLNSRDGESTSDLCDVGAHDYCALLHRVSGNQICAVQKRGTHSPVARVRDLSDVTGNSNEVAHARRVDSERARAVASLCQALLETLMASLLHLVWRCKGAASKEHGADDRGGGLHLVED